ncbi:hypothetical protein BD413DRAFT_534366, partial [Trametes elegans]
MAAVSAPHPSRIHSPEIIDVDALEDEPVVFTGFHGRPRQPPQARSSAGPSVIAHDEDITYTGFRRSSSRRARYPSLSAQAGPSAGPARDNVIVLDSDEDMPSYSSGRRSSS